MTRKTLIISNAVAVHLLSIVAALSSAQAIIPEELLDEQIEAFDGFKITHTHSSHGLQYLIMDRIHPNFFVTSFCGSQEFLNEIDSGGWESTFDSLFNYFNGLDPEVVMEHGQFAFVDIDQHYQAIVLSGEEGIFDDPDPDLPPALIKALGISAITGACDHVVRVHEASFEVTETVEVDDAANAKNESPQASAAPKGFTKKFVRRAEAFFASTQGQTLTVTAIATIVGVGLMVFFGPRLAERISRS